MAVLGEWSDLSERGLLVEGWADSGSRRAVRPPFPRFPSTSGSYRSPSTLFPRLRTSLAGRCVFLSVHHEPKNGRVNVVLLRFFH